ncbi:GGDEF domain-containing protein [Pseudohongiella sp.]|uniref:GGDEF domain-containing protein n=1 Tax=marine sediment metagenome TaxID=412755 RepID=A0A0F9W850_9ZZZZ|nr:GGDEF domain-containing protein [Pseudohongiella sp.]HDZ07721.1 GGDEF domain-containing protein [Pseudohongiella sp.]HEA63301.1 GGDEF domain-containing protein [Pseudohongiella sp.]
MIQLDIATLTLTFVSLALTTVIVLFLIWRINRNMPGVVFWLIGGLLLLTSTLSLFLGVELDFPEGLSPFISNSLSLPGNMLLMEGTLRFRGFASRRRWVFLLALIPVFLLASWINRYDAAARYIFHDSFAMTFQLITAAAFVWRTRDRDELYANILAAVGSALMAGSVSVRLLMALGNSDQVSGGTGSTVTQWYLFTGTNFYVMWMFGISVACYFRSRQQVMQLAREDSLTGLPNRRCIDERLLQTLAECKRSKEAFAVLMADINDFKLVNDRFGHSAGDRLLHGIAERLRDAVREADFAGRLGGDEFLVIARHVDSTEALEQVVSRLRTSLEGPLDIPGGSFNVRVSIGAVISPGGGDTADRLLGAADAEMYRDKARIRAMK